MTRAVRNAIAGFVGVVLGLVLGVVSCDPLEPRPATVFAGNPVPRSSTTSTTAGVELLPPLVLEQPATTSTSSAPSSHGRRLLGTFKVTCYGPPMFPAGQTTYSGQPVGPGSIAVDRQVIPLGTVLEVEGYGRGVANDIGGAVHGAHVDLWVSDPTPCPVPSGARVWAIE